MKGHLLSGRRESFRVALVAAAALATGVSVAVLGQVPFPGIGERENIAVVTIAGLVIFAAGLVVAGVIFRGRNRQP